AIFGGRGDLQLHMADHAGLIEQIAALQLLGSEGVAGRKGLRRGKSNPSGKHQRSHHRTGRHSAFSRTDRVEVLRMLRFGRLKEKRSRPRCKSRSQAISAGTLTREHGLVEYRLRMEQFLL